MELLDSDYVQTPEWCAKDMIDYFKPSGKILDPCRGENKVFHNILQCDFAEIKEGIDFFAIQEKYDWIIEIHLIPYLTNGLNIATR